LRDVLLASRATGSRAAALDAVSAKAFYTQDFPERLPVTETSEAIAMHPKALRVRR
jgi:hypothetical protein